MREVPFKNYIKLAILLFVTISLTISTSLIYQNYRKSIKSYVSKNIHNINAKEMSIYMQENDYVILFVTSSKNTENDEKCEELLSDKKVKDFSQYMIYLDRDKKKNTSYVEETFDIKVNDDMILLIEDGKLVNYVNLKECNINEFSQLMKGDMND